MLDAGEPVQVVDARPRACVSWTQEVMQGATWRDPERVPEWVGELSKFSQPGGAPLYGTNGSAVP